MKPEFVEVELDALQWAMLINEDGLLKFIEFTAPCPGGDAHIAHCKGQIKKFLKEYQGEELEKP